MVTIKDRKRNILGWTFGGIACVGITGLLLQWFRPSPPIRISAQTTYLTAPLGSDGLPDYKLAQMLRQGRGVAPEENAAVSFWQAMGRSEWEPAEWAVLGRELGFEPPPDDRGLSQQHHKILDVIQDWVSAEHPALDQHGPYTLSEQILDRCQSQPWRAAECPPIAEVLDSYGPYYDLLHQAAQRQVFYSPGPVGESSVDISMELTSSLREMIWALGRRASLRIGEGDLEGAWADLRSALVLSTLPHCDLNIDVLIQIACEGAVHHQLKYLLADEAITPAIVDDVLRTLDQLPDPMNQMKGALLGERLFGIQWVIENRTNPAESFSDGWPEFHSSDLVRGSVNWNVTLEQINLAYNRLAPILAIADRGTRRDQLQVWSYQFQQDYQHIRDPWVRAIGYINPSKRSRIVADELTGMTAGSHMMVLDAVEQAVVRRDLTRLAVKLTAYRLATGATPENLRELIPRVFAAEPLDGIYGLAMEYRRLPGDGVLLYSRGPNGQDDHGSRNLNSVYRGIDLPDWLAQSNEADADRVKHFFLQAGVHTLPANLLDPQSWIAAGADDISWRTPPPSESLQELLERQMTELGVDEDGEMQLQ